MATYLTISLGFSSQFVNKLCLTLDVISSSGVKSARVFESEYLLVLVLPCAVPFAVLEFKQFDGSPPVVFCKEAKHGKRYS